MRRCPVCGRRDPWYDVGVCGVCEDERADTEDELFRDRSKVSHLEEQEEKPKD